MKILECEFGGSVQGGRVQGRSLSGTQGGEAPVGDWVGGGAYLNEKQKTPMKKKVDKNTYLLTICFQQKGTKVYSFI